MNQFVTLEESKQFLRDNFKDGATCPCCGQFVKQYTRPMHVTMALMLIKLYKLDRQQAGYYHVSELVKGVIATGTSDFSKLRYWDMVTEQAKDPDVNQRTSGYWAITVKGIAFAEGRISAPQKVVIFNKKAYGLVGKQVYIRDVLGNKFDYNELMLNKA